MHQLVNKWNFDYIKMLHGTNVKKNYILSLWNTYSPASILFRFFLLSSFSHFLSSYWKCIQGNHCGSRQILGRDCIMRSCSLSPEKKTFRNAALIRGAFSVLAWASSLKLASARHALLLPESHVACGISSSVKEISWIHTIACSLLTLCRLTTPIGVVLHR